MKSSKTIQTSDVTALKKIETLNIVQMGRLIYPLGLIVILLIILLFIEYKHPYFFLQDDNRDFFLPYFVHNYKSLLNKEIALYNFHQFLGTPNLAVGQSAVLYPITYLSIFLSDLIFGQYFAAIDIEVILHLLIGAVGFYRLMRYFGIEPGIACFGGITWPLSSFVVYVSNSWVVVSAAAAYFPWMLLFSFQLYKSPSLKAIIYVVVVRLLLFYSGHIQYFIYSVIFEFLTLIIYVMSDSLSSEKKVKAFKFLRKYVEGYIYVFVFSLPLLLPMWYQTSISARRSDKFPFEEFFSPDYPINQLIQGLFFPFIETKYTSVYSHLSHIGYLSVYFLIIGFVYKIGQKSKAIFINSVQLYTFTVPAIIAFLWANNRVFNSLIYMIPILNRFRYPFKLDFFLSFYLIILATIVLSYIFTQYKYKVLTKNILCILIIMVQIFNFTLLYTAFPTSFGYHDDSLPLEEKLQDKLIGGRIISIGFDIWSKEQKDFRFNYLTAPTLGFNYATLWGLDYFAGYEPLISAKNLRTCLGLNHKAIMKSDDQIPVEYLRKAAVCWYIVPKSKVNEYSEKFKAYRFAKKYEDENRVVFYDSKAYPMVFNSIGKKIESMDYRVTTNCIELSIDIQQSDMITFNYLYNPFFEGFIDGKKTNLMQTDDIHFSIWVPKGKHHIIVSYKDSYLLAGIYFMIAFIVLIVSIRIIRILLRNNLK